MDGVSALIKEAPESSLTSSAMCGPSQKSAACSPEDSLPWNLAGLQPPGP